ncbi:MAG: hypothetical protein ACOYJ1_15690 [Peptococcales bacterium]
MKIFEGVPTVGCQTEVISDSCHRWHQTINGERTGISVLVFIDDETITIKAAGDSICPDTTCPKRASCPMAEGVLSYSTQAAFMLLPLISRTVDEYMLEAYEHLEKEQILAN